MKPRPQALSGAASAAFTAGPWKLSDSIVTETLEPCVVNALGLAIAAVMDDGHGEDEAEANGLLLAAAPDMHYALALIADIAEAMMLPDSLPDIARIARAALVKAAA